MEFRFPASPIQALQLINEDGTFYPINNNGQCKMVRFARTGQGADYGQAAGTVIKEADIGAELLGNDFECLASIGLSRPETIFQTMGP